jgi:hypothetical protein
MIFGRPDPADLQRTGMSENTQALPTSSELAQGTVVEMTKTLLADSAGGLRVYKALGRRPAGSVNGADYFGVSIGERARVIRQEGEAVLLEILEGPWKGREGWASRDGLRVPPTDVESSANPVGGFSLLARREIYAASHAAEMKAVALADSRYPFDRIPADPQGAAVYLSEREKVYREARAEGRREVIERYGIDAHRLDAIDQEGDREKWPLWDGLSDERGPIPNFGPARTDESGRIVMSDEEQAARREAAIRALAVVGQITDETDTDEVWAEAFRGLEGAS